MAMPELGETEVFEKGLDFRPKCPIVRNQSGDVQNECGGDRCAWWDAGVAMCCRKSGAIALRGILEELREIKKKILV